MDEFIKTPTMSEILKEEFMKPMNLTAYKLAQNIDIPVSRIQAILNDEQKITLDVSSRLAKFFGVSDGYFLDLQSNLDVRTNTATNKI
jgi:antitoxin HigA-1